MASCITKKFHLSFNFEEKKLTEFSHGGEKMIFSSEWNENVTPDILKKKLSK